MTGREETGRWAPSEPLPATASGPPGPAPEPWPGRAILTRGRWLSTMLALGGLSLAAGLLALRFGAEAYTFREIAQVVSERLSGGRDAGTAASTILLQVRLPRVMLAFLVGGALAGVGVGLQALLRNPLADPYVLGVSSGAALGAALATLLGLGTAVWAVSALPLCAMIGGLLSIGVIYRIAATHGRLPVYMLLLAGVILNAIFTALIMFVTSIMAPSRSFGMMQWLMGTLTAPSYGLLVILAVYVLLGGLVLLRQARPLNLLTLGDETARALGVDVERVKKTVFFCSALLTGAVVSVSGMIGFVGMVVPHAVRMVIGPDHRLLLPASALVGGSYLLVADTLARTALAPGELPVGIITALAGGPFFIYLLVSRKSGVRH